MVLTAPRHFRRIEIKYLIPDRIIPALCAAIAPYTQPDPFLVQEGKGRTDYPVLSLYFDSSDLQSLREKDAGILSRRKVRLRTYAESFLEKQLTFLEIKRRRDVVISKDRLTLPSGALENLAQSFDVLSDALDRVEGKGEVLSEARFLHSWYGLRPVCTVSYLRLPYVGMQDRRFRITLDQQICGAWMPGSWSPHSMLTACRPGWSVLEMKCDHAIPAWFHRIIQEFQLKRVAHSKYALVMSDLRDMLLSNTFASFQDSPTLALDATRDS